MADRPANRRARTFGQLDTSLLKVRAVLSRYADSEGNLRRHFLTRLLSKLGIAEQSANELLASIPAATTDTISMSAFLDEVFGPEEKPDISDPKTVFALCDVDRSCTLDRTQLNHALRALGYDPKHSDIEPELDTAYRHDKICDLNKFLSLVQRLRQLFPDMADSSPKVVPHALRGISLAQLQQVNKVFVKSGWLGEQCRDHNLSRRQQIAEGKEFELHENLYSMSKFIVSPLTEPGRDCQARTRVQEASPSWCREAPRKCSFSELLNHTGLVVDFFVSHFWGHPFDTTLQSLLRWATRQAPRVGKGHLAEVTFWICLFAVNQHFAADEVGKEPVNGPFNAALIHACFGGIMVVDSKASPLKRIWCLFEVHRLDEEKKEWDLICEHGVLTSVCDGNKDELERYVAAVEESLQDLSALTAQAAQKEDQHKIWHCLCDPWLRNWKLDRIVKEDKFNDKGVFTCFDERIRGLLSCGMLRRRLAQRDVECSLRCLQQGALFGEAELESLASLGQSPRAERPGERPLICMAARTGNVTGLKAIVDRRADLETRDPSNKKTALIQAAVRGHALIVRTLLEWKADVEATAGLEWSALHDAAGANRLDVVRVLLESRARIDHKDTKGRTALEVAKTRGHEACARQLQDATAERA